MMETKSKKSKTSLRKTRTDNGVTVDGRVTDARGMQRSTPVIQFRDVYRTYEMGDQVLNALDGVDLEISRNEYVAIVGCFRFG